MTQHSGSAKSSVTVAPSTEALIDQAAALFVQTARDAMAERGAFHVALSGGNTPRPLFEKLASEPYRSEIDWSRTQVFFSDERFVPAESSDSNFHMAREALLSSVPIPDRFVHPVATVDVQPEEAAANYEEGLRRVFSVGLDEIPVFDLILLGIGPDGHTASLFPGTEALGVTNRLVTANFVPHLDTWRVSFTYPVINAARTVLFLVTGADKAETLRRVLDDEGDLPASGVKPTTGNVLWLVDAAAGGQVSQNLRASEPVVQPSETTEHAQ